MGAKVTPAEFARLIEVSRQAVHSKIQEGRLTRSLVKITGKVHIDVVEGIFEYYMNADTRKDRGHHQQPLTLKAKQADDVMPIAEANALDRHYAALLRKVEYSERIKELIPADKFRQEAFQAARAVRDALAYLPQETNADFKRLTLALLRKHLSEEALSHAQKDLDSVALEFKVILKASIKKALYELVNSRLGTEDLKTTVEGAKDE